MKRLKNTFDLIGQESKSEKDRSWDAFLTYKKYSNIMHPALCNPILSPCAAHIGMDGMRIEKEPRQETNM
jgi:hypothetical protein